MRWIDIYQALLNSLTLDVSKGEKESIIRWLMEDRSGISWSTHTTDKNTEADLRITDFENDLKRLNSGEPLQHILGYTEFYGRRFKVTPNVLIPRPETELLIIPVKQFLQENANPHILDIGTGSGCIAITLALELQHGVVFATDKSTEALNVARENARLNGVAVEFIRHDILQDKLDFENLDVVVSNPPYIRLSERKTMSVQVTQHEPHLALFVPDEDPMVFHRAIAEKSRAALKPGGLVLLEINEALGKASSHELEHAGFQQVTIIKDLDGKDRFVSGRTPR